MDVSLFDQIHRLKLQAFKKGDFLSVTGPTWCIKDNGNIETYYDSFEIDPLGALRDFGAQPANGQRPFFRDPRVLDQQAIPGLKSPISDNFNIAPWFKPHPEGRYFFAADLSVSSDATGVALTHWDVFEEKVVLDFSLQIKGTPTTPVNYSDIRELLYELSRRGFNIQGVGFDQFQSNDSVHIINEYFGWEIAKVIKYASSFAGCLMLHDLIHSGKFFYGDFNEVFIGEAKELQRVNDSRVDHTLSGQVFNSKDVWDAVVNSVYLCLEDKHARSFEVQRSEKFARIARDLAKNTHDRAIYNHADLDWLL
jgi:hypothetical protein